MTAAGGDIGWVVAGALLAGSGTVLCVRGMSYVSGSLLAVSGALVVVAGAEVVEQGQWLAVLGMALLALALVAHPRVDRRAATLVAVAGIVVGTPVLTRWLADGADLGTSDFVWLASGLAAVVACHLWLRLETGPPATRGPVLWVLSTAGLSLFVIGAATVANAPETLAALAHASLGAIGLAAVVGVDQRRAFDGRWWASHAAAWSFAAAAAFAMANLLLAVVEWRSGGPPGPIGVALVAVACGVAWSPLLALVQRVSDGVLFGFRPDALTAAQRVAVGVGDDPAAAVRAIQEGLVLPYTALDLVGEELIETGSPTTHRRVFPIDVDGEHAGDLVVGVRPGDSGLSRDDERVLMLSLPLLVQTMRARSLAASLQRARVASAAGREEERRRLRRDLHDGLGPRLTGIAFTADAARLASADSAVAPMLDRIRAEAETALGEIREMAYALRPPALDELGLLGAIKIRVETLDGPHVTVDATTLPPLPAAVEVAAYRIVMEALTNVVRHSGATRATVVLRADPASLVVSVSDDGSSSGGWVPGVGLTSMRERAAELGGTVTYRTSARGSTVVAHLPSAAPPVVGDRADG